MIYLIDDNQSNLRQKNYNITYIEEGVFNDILVSIDKLRYIANPYDVTHLDILKNAACILLHVNTEDYSDEFGYLPGSKSNVIKIKEIISDEGDNVPLVLFSNEMGEAHYEPELKPNVIQSIKKNILYNNLYDFLESYKKNGIIKFQILAWGKNYESYKLTKLAQRLKSIFRDKKETEILEIRHLLLVYEDFKEFITVSYCGELDVSEILIQIEDYPKSIGEFINKIDNIVNSYLKYGKNIYPW
jgi:hypothetical protein